MGNILLQFGGKVFEYQRLFVRDNFKESNIKLFTLILAFPVFSESLFNSSCQCAVQALAQLVIMHPNVKVIFSYLCVWYKSVQNIAGSGFVLCYICPFPRL